MKILIRSFLTILSILASFYFTFWVPGAFLSDLPFGPFLSFLLSLAVAFYIGKFAWKKSDHLSGGVLVYILYGALAIGGISFCTGFFGPIIFAPEANQGPLLGILVTGPIGFLVGGFLGFLYWYVRGKNNDQNS